MAAGLLAASALSSANPVEAAPITTEDAACASVKAQVSARGRFPQSAIAFCDIIAAEDSPSGYYVMALHSTRVCDGICSTNMGWFAIETATGRVFEWEVEGVVGPPIDAEPSP